MAYKDLDPKFTALCSLKTVQENENGFFGEFYECVSKSCPKKWLNEVFALAKSDREKIELTFNDHNMCGEILGSLEHVQPVYKEKSAKISHSRRLEGERAHVAGNLRTALLFASQAVIRAPEKGVDVHVDGGLSLGLALWMRSSVLLDMGEGEKALQDLQYALVQGLPAKQNGEYYGRLARAYAIIGDLPKSNISLGIAEKFLGKDSDLYHRTLNKLENTTKQPPKIQTEALKVAQSQHPELSGASSKLELKSTVMSGNFICAKDDIDVGEVVLSEQPIASALLPKFCGLYCTHCLCRLTAPIGCPQCSGIAFCSVKCQQEACSTYHRYECPYMDLLIGSGMSILCFIALRIITQSPSPSEAVKNAFNVINKLCAHREKRKPADFLQRCTMTAFLLRVLQKSNFFGRRITEGVDPTPIEMDVAEAILGLLQVLQFNVHEVFAEAPTPENKETSLEAKYVNVGAAIYATGSMFNHDCYPSVARCFSGTTLIFRAIRPMTKGQTVAENYGPIFTKKTLLERKRALQSRYWFNCECQTCKEDWPLLTKLDDDRCKLRCTTSTCDNIMNFPKMTDKPVKCSQCRKNIDFKESILALRACEFLYREGAEHMQAGKIQDAIEKFIEGIQVFSKVGYPPHKPTHYAQDSLRICYSNLK